VPPRHLVNGARRAVRLAVLQIQVQRGFIIVCTREAEMMLAGWSHEQTP